MNEYNKKFEDKQNYRDQREQREQREHRLNHEIRVPKILLIDENEEKKGIIFTKDALNQALTAGLDLVEVSPNSQPPVCKIMDYNKYLYHLKKKKKHNEAANRVEDHEIRLTPTIADHDLLIKAKKVREFLEKNSKVKIQVKLEGREKRNLSLIEETSKRLAVVLADCSKMEYSGGQYILIPHKQS
jgi:translation initiation factor IF-3